VVRSQLFDSSSRAALASRIRSGLSRAGLRPISVTFVSVLQAAPVVIAEASNQAAVLEATARPSWWTRALGDIDNYEGYYLELRDASGRAFAISTSANRAGSSSSWIRPDLHPPLRVHAITSGPARHGAARTHERGAAGR
jgi:hypothetical protein